MPPCGFTRPRRCAIWRARRWIIPTSTTPRSASRPSCGGRRGRGKRRRGDAGTRKHGDREHALADSFFSSPRPRVAASQRHHVFASARQDDAMSPPPLLRLRITSDPANLAPVRHQIEGFCAACGFDEKARGQIVLCVNEALANVTRHAYLEATDVPIHLDVEFTDGLLKIKIRDWGTGRLPPQVPRP